MVNETAQTGWLPAIVFLKQNNLIKLFPSLQRDQTLL